MRKSFYSITDSQILAWNKKIPAYSFIPIFSKKTGQADISISLNNYYLDPIFPNKPISHQFCDNQEIEYTYSFSVAKSRVEHFFDIVGKLKSLPLFVKFVNNNRETDIHLSDDDYTETQIEHRIVNKDYIKFTYNFKAKITNVILQVTYIEDAIEFFNLLWGYTEEGEEVCLLKYKIGDVVCIDGDKSEDYLIVDYIFEKYNKYDITYMISRLLINGDIITYDKPKIVMEKSLSPSRNNRIDNICN